MKTLKLGVGVCTRQRPYMFKALLEELARQRIPKATELTFIFVENDADVRIAQTVNDFRKSLAARGVEAQVCLEPEPRLGIPFARNRVLDIALHLGLDYLAVLDDDDYPADETWLSEMLNGIHGRRLDVASGLFRIEPMSREELSSFRLMPRIVYRFLSNARKEKRKIASCRRGEDGQAFHSASNVIYRLSLFRRHGIRFNERLGLAHGDDRELNFEIRQAGGKGGLIPQAVAYERLRDERLTLRYQFQYHRASFLVRYSRHYRGSVRSTKSGSLRVCSLVFGKLVLGTFRLLLTPATGGRSLVGAARSFGSAVGAAEGLLGRQSRHYAETDGQ